MTPGILLNAIFFLELHADVDLLIIKKGKRGRRLCLGMLNRLFDGACLILRVGRRMGFIVSFCGPLYRSLGTDAMH